MACRLTAGSTIKLLAWAPRGDVLYNTGDSDTPHNANGVGWYYGTSESWGFAKQGDTIKRVSCDDLKTGTNNQRLCWHTSSTSITSGYRCGDVTATGDAYDRLMFHR